jgi:hypothetical protein
LAGALSAWQSLHPAAKARSADPSEVGEWSSYVLWPTNATHSVLLPTGKLLFWQALGSYLWNPATEAVTATPPPGHNIFCAGHSLTGDGRVLVTGGHRSPFRGLKKASYYDPFSNTWTSLPDMNAGRWYPTNTILPNGDVLVTSGYITPDELNRLPQVWQVASASWRNLTTARRPVPAYPQMFVASDGRVFMAGPSRMTRYLDIAGTGAWSNLRNSNFGDRSFGTAVMYDEDKVLIAGGGPPPALPTNTVEVIDLKAERPVWRYVAPMAEARRYPHATLLADGTILVSGGLGGTNDDTCDFPVYLAEIWNPQTEAWSNVASAAICRGEHQTATLLPDGRVVSAGGDNADPSGDNREIYSPPYLFKGPRPTITSAPTTVGYGQTFFVETPEASMITHVNMLALGAPTHGFNMGQRINRLTFSLAEGGLNITTPATAALCPPGYYMLFILTGDGVPSVAPVIRVN